MGALQSRFYSLHTLVGNGDVTGVKALLSRKPQLVDELQVQRTALFNSVCDQRNDVTHVLLERGADPNVLCIKELNGYQYAWSTIHEACRLADRELLVNLIDHGADVNLGAHHQMSPLHVAAWSGHLDIVQCLLDQGCSLNQLDKFKESAIAIPVCHGNRQMVESLLLAGCKLNSYSWGNLRKISGKYDSEFRASLYSRQGPYSLLTLALLYAWPNIGALLLQHGFSPNRYQISDILDQLQASEGSFGEDSKRFISAYLAAGYRFREKDETRLLALLESSTASGNPGQGEIVDYLLHCLRVKVPSLKELCRTDVRTRLRVLGKHASIVPRVEALPLPRTLTRYLLLSDEVLDYSMDSETSDVIEYQKSAQTPLYFAMPRRRKNNDVHVYIQFWMTSCCCTCSRSK